MERLEIGYWASLFAYAPAFETIAVVLEKVMAEVPVEVPAEVATMRKLARTANKQGKLPQEDPGEVGRTRG